MAHVQSSGFRVGHSHECGWSYIDHLRILIAEDNKAVRQGIRTLLESQQEWQVVAAVENGPDALEAAKVHRPDVAIIDISMPGLDGITVAQRMRDCSPESALLILTQHDAPFTVRRALQAGALGYVLKSDAGEELIPAIQAVHQKQCYLSHTFSDLAPA
jgi:DNA-binding NarL/FixJ family response regulator